MTNKRIYDSQKWKNKRSRTLRKGNYLCELCLRTNKRNAAEVVHHIVPVEKSDLLAYQDFNLISLCRRCHEHIHKRESHELSELGLELVKELVQQSYIPPSILEVLKR